MGQFIPPEASIHAPQHLPVIPPRQIVGRNRELGQVYSQIRAGMPVLLHGPAGIGKSALAATIATAYTTFKGGVLWWSVTGDDLTRLVARLERAYGQAALAENAGHARQLERAAGLLQNRPLIVLDDLDDFDAAREFARKVAASVPLIITAEQGASGPWIPFGVSTLSQSDAEALFVQASRLDATAVGVRGVLPRLCAALGGIPLDLLIVARHVAVSGQTPADFLRALEAADAGRPDFPGLAVAFSELPEALRRMLVTLGGTPAGQASVALLAALQLASVADVTRDTDGLVQRGLAFALPQRDDVPGYAIHRQVHRFVQAWLQNNGHLGAMRARVHEALLATLARDQANTPAVQARLAMELPNLLALARQAAAQDDTATVQRVIAILSAVFAGNAAYDYERAVLEALIAPAPADDREGESEVEIRPEPAQATLSLPDAAVLEPVEPDVEVQAPQDALAAFVEDGLSGAAETVDLLDDLIPAEEEVELWNEEVLEADEAEQPPEIGAVSTKDVRADFVEDGLDSAVDVEDLMEAVVGVDGDVVDSEFAAIDGTAGSEPALQMTASAVPAVAGEGITLDALLKASREARLSGDRVRLAAALVMLGQAWTERGEYEQAQAALNEALAAYNERNDAPGMLEALEALAAVSLETGDLDNAVVYATRAENLASQAGNTSRRGHVLALLGDIRLELGELDEAVRTYVGAIEALQTASDPVSLGVVQAKLGATYMDRGDFTPAVTMLSSARAIFARAGLDEYEERVLGNLGMAYGQLGQWKEAEKYHRQALLLAQRLDDTVEQEHQLANLGYAAHAQQKWDAMQVHYRAALDLAYRTENGEWQLRYLDVLGQNLMDNAAQVGLAVALLEEADRLQPDVERERLLGRARKRLLRLEQAGITQEPIPLSIAEWAAGARF